MRYSRGSCANTRREDRRCLPFLHLTIVAGVPRPRCESRVSDRDGSGEKKGKKQSARDLRARTSAGHPDIEINSHFGSGSHFGGIAVEEVDGPCKRRETYEKTALLGNIQGGSRESWRKFLECVLEFILSKNVQIHYGSIWFGYRDMKNLNLVSWFWHLRPWSILLVIFGFFGDNN